MDFPPDIITNILYRLPAKSLGRFRCVSKSWQAHLSEPQFIKHHQNTLNHNHLICASFCSSLYSLPCNQLEENPKKVSSELPRPDIFIFLGSCNGLVLGFAEDFVNAHSLVIFNPTTTEFFILPESNYEMVNKLLEITIMYGFGYDAHTDDYKVVTISYFRYNYLVLGDNIMSLHIYSLRNNIWKCGIDSPYDHSLSKNLHGVYVSGFLHWIVNKGFNRVPVIVAFSLADETFSEVQLPNLDGRVDIMSKTSCKLVVFGEKLGLLMEDGVWLMNEYGVRESWIEILIHGLHEIPMIEQKIFYEDGKLLLISGDLIWIYDVEEGSFCRTTDISRNVTGLKVKGGYAESLVSPKFGRTN